MKRHGQLLAGIAEMENLRLAFHRAARGKQGKADVRRYSETLDDNLSCLRSALLTDTAVVGYYQYFRVHDPKERIICAAQFSERVLHHALMNVCEPVLERAAIGDSFACRVGKGRDAALVRAQEFARRYPWFLQLDIRKYFDSVSHEVLRTQLHRKFKDPALLRLFDRIISSYETVAGRGLPIGNLTSQHFANYYLAPLDRFLKERLQRGGYVRYMDDFVVWGESGAELSSARQAVREYLHSELRLELKNEGIINRTSRGMEFLGARVFATRLGLARRSKLRFRRKLVAYERQFELGLWSEAELQRRVGALLAFVRSARCDNFRRGILCREGNPAERLQPRDPRGQLEQHRGQPPLCHPQQQHAVEPQYEHRVPLRPSPVAAPDGVGLARLASRPSPASTEVANLNKPPGASRVSENSGRFSHLDL